MSTCAAFLVFQPIFCLLSPFLCLVSVCCNVEEGFNSTKNLFQNWNCIGSRLSHRRGASKGEQRILVYKRYVPDVSEERSVRLLLNRRVDLVEAQQREEMQELKNMMEQQRIE